MLGDLEEASTLLREWVCLAATPKEEVGTAKRPTVRNNSRHPAGLGESHKGDGVVTSRAWELREQKMAEDIEPDRWTHARWRLG